MRQLRLPSRKIKIFILILVVAFSGCQTAPTTKSETSKEIISAVGTVTTGLTNKKLSEQDLKALAVEVQKDPQAKSAVEAVNTSFKVQDTSVKYCPVDGERFSSRLELCPRHQVKLKPVE